MVNHRRHLFYNFCSSLCFYFMELHTFKINIQNIISNIIYFIFAPITCLLNIYIFNPHPSTCLLILEKGGGGEREGKISVGGKH